MTIVIPTLSAGAKLAECLQALARQTFRDFDVIVVDNGGGAARRVAETVDRVRVIENPGNLGFGGAVNQGFRASSAPFVATINDDTVAAPEFLEELARAMENDARAGICAPRVMLRGTDRLDSAGMGIARDGSSRQRGHGQPITGFEKPQEILVASGSAVLYRRAMLDEIGAFDESFFMYCEDTDLSLRAHWAGWTAQYVPTAVIEHALSTSAGRGSALKAYYVERNRLWLVVKNLPLSCLWRVPFYAVARYFWHWVSLRRGLGETARFEQAGGGVPQLAWYTLRAHLELLPALPRLWKQRREIRRSARVSASQFCQALRRHTIGVREVAEL